MSRTKITNKLYTIVREKYKMNKAINKGYLKNMNVELMKSDIDYDLLALGLGRACNLKNQNKYITDIGTYSNNLKKW
tara:strand:+ start:675 stop:905 length:231 start_codon:yes stop_codon:yes gene_type:complete